MEGLVYKEGEFKWVKVDLSRSTLDRDSFYDKDGNHHKGCDVIKFKGDIRNSKKKYVICRNCRCIIAEDKFAKHSEKNKAKANCLKCKNMDYRNTVVDHISRITQNEDGTVSMSQQITFKPYCKFDYCYCDNAKAQNGCKYYRCNHYANSPLQKTALSEYPKMFEGKLLTSKDLLKHGWTVTPSNICRFTKGNISAIVDIYGRFENFVIETRTATVKFIYSKYYDKFFREEYNEGYAFNPLTFTNYTSEKNAEKICKEIKKLYEEV